MRVQGKRGGRAPSPLGSVSFRGGDPRRGRRSNVSPSWRIAVTKRKLQEERGGRAHPLLIGVLFRGGEPQMKMESQVPPQVRSPRKIGGNPNSDVGRRTTKSIVLLHPRKWLKLYNSGLHPELDQVQTGKRRMAKAYNTQVY
ncbi:UNVERIFIED_CONTAM: hypothetical protein Sradi_0979700 [Sesamum radiatum]|uniref:Uncharacterized protein n=1 Tax=Sesamum radiatum TaxID=300843 RepID=A0AAW2V492_SESRA